MINFLKKQIIIEDVNYQEEYVIGLCNIHGSFVVSKSDSGKPCYRCVCKNSKPSLYKKTLENISGYLFRNKFINTENTLNTYINIQKNAQNLLAISINESCLKVQKEIDKSIDNTLDWCNS